MGQKVKRLLIFDNQAEKSLGSDKLFYIKPAVFLAAPANPHYDLEPVLELLYSQEVKELLEKHGLTALPRSEQNKETLPLNN